jgi:serine/threonine protein kinase
MSLAFKRNIKLDKEPMGTYFQQFSSHREELLTNCSNRNDSSVFMGADKDTGEIVALKRINTEQEENGFPITAIREVKILKALSHDNIVTLKGIVTSKGAYIVQFQPYSESFSALGRKWQYFLFLSKFPQYQAMFLSRFLV